jgi:hypothetical protein
MLAVVMGDVLGELATQVRLATDNEVVQTFPPDGLYPGLGDGVQVRRPRCLASGPWREWTTARARAGLLTSLFAFPSCELLNSPMNRFESQSRPARDIRPSAPSPMSMTAFRRNSLSLIR